jgi:hypothetical protein
MNIISVTALLLLGLLLASFQGQLGDLFSWPSANMAVWRWVFSLGVVVTMLHVMGQLEIEIQETGQDDAPG